MTTTPEMDDNKIGVPPRRELFEPLDSNFEVSDLKVLVLARLVVKLNLGEFSKLPHEVRASLKKSVCTFYSQYITKYKDVESPVAFVEKEKKWLDNPMWLDTVAKNYISSLQSGGSMVDEDGNLIQTHDDGSDIEGLAIEDGGMPRKREQNSDFDDEEQMQVLRRKKRKSKPHKIIGEEYLTSESGRKKKAGRPKKDWERLSVASKRKASYILSNQHTVEELLAAAFHGAHKEYRNDVARAIKQCREVLANPPLNNQPKIYKKPAVWSPNECVNLLIDSNMTQRCYQGLRLSCKAKNADIFPTYRHVGVARLLCYPKTIQVNQTVAEVPLQSLLNHTAERLLNLKKELIKTIKPEVGRLKLNLSVKWGYDGSTGSTEWRQRFMTDSIRDSNDADLFCTALVPLSLKNPDTLLWENPTPSNVRFCRPLSIQFGKETPELAFEAQSRVEGQIRDLQPVIVTVDLTEGNKDDGFGGDDDNPEGMAEPTSASALTKKGPGRPPANGVKEGEEVPAVTAEVQVFYHVQHTVIEPNTSFGTFGTNSSRDPNCHICLSNPQVISQFEHQIIPNQDAHKYVLSSNHAWVTCFETLLTLSSFLPQESWAGRADVNIRMAQRKIDIQKAFRKELGIIVDKPRSGYSVSTAEAASAKKAFAAYEEFSRLTGLDRELIHRFNVILTSMSCEYEAIGQEFGEYCLATADHFASVYRWFQPPTTVHKILYHGEIMLRDYIIPIGMMSEEAQKARNKDSKTFFRRHAKKESKEHVMTEVIKYLMVQGDPVVSEALLEQRKEKQNWKVFDDDVVRILSTPNKGDVDVTRRKRKFIQKTESVPVEDPNPQNSSIPDMSFHDHSTATGVNVDQHKITHGMDGGLMTAQPPNDLGRAKAMPVNLEKTDRNQVGRSHAAYATEAPAPPAPAPVAATAAASSNISFPEPSFIPTSHPGKIAAAAHHNAAAAAAKLQYSHGIIPNLFELAYQDPSRFRAPYAAPDLSTSRAPYQGSSSSSSKIQSFQKQVYQDPSTSKSTFHNPPPSTQPNFHPGSFAGTNFPYHQ
ncbi:unnamed protein product [Meganyctiphanes norvegica]|uniref:Uncharacterized protein n=1 Tax=Meganyctiphanes norvegica TaxID=48144 RepID=A0AAV2SM21_MEGNR